MVEIILDYYVYQQSYSSLKSKNVVKFCVHISPIFSCPVTYIIKNTITNSQYRNPDLKYRPKFLALVQSFSQPSHVLFHWIEKDKQAGGPQCDALGALLEAGHNLYPDLQIAYKSASV